MKQNEMKPVNDYWKFTRELKAQMNLIKVYERQFFELDDLCEWSVKNDVTVMDFDKGERVSVVEESLSDEQAAVYEKMRVEVGNLYDMLCQGRSCFNLEKS